MERSFQKEFHSVRGKISQYLPKKISSELDHIVNNGNDFNADLWAKIVYHFTTAYKNLDDESNVYTLLDALKTLWIGRFVSYARHVEHMDMNGAEKVIQDQAKVFENQFEYLKTIYQHSEQNHQQ
jgi:hypothetical protein